VKGDLPLVVDTRRSSSWPGSRVPASAHKSSPPSTACPQTGPGATTAPPALIEAFVQAPRWTSAVYRGSGLIHVGAMQGGALRPR